MGPVRLVETPLPAFAAPDTRPVLGHNLYDRRLGDLARSAPLTGSG